MIKSSAKSEQLRSRTGSFATRPSHTGVDLLGLGLKEVEKLTPEQEREVITSRLLQIQGQARALKLQKINASQSDKCKINLQLNELGGETQVLAARSAALRRETGKPKNGDDLSRYIISVVKESLTKPQWAAILKEAQKRLERGDPV